MPKPVSQLWIATHSSLFDLDPTGFWEVTHTPEAGTSVVRNPRLADLHRHVWEPGAALQVLLDGLRAGAQDRVVARRGDGTPVSASEMTRLLLDDAPEALAFVRLVTAAAVRMVGDGPTS